MSTGTLTRPNANPVLDMMRDADMTDPWGTAIGYAFAVCDVLYDADPNTVPAALGVSARDLWAGRAETGE